jgi:dihydrofolate reductase
MPKVALDMSVSLDGFASGPDDDLSRVHAWMSRTSAKDAIDEFMTAGAVLAGKRTFDQGQEPWGDEPPFPMPVFVLTHEKREPMTKGASTFTFVTGIEDALRQARAAAGEKDVIVMGGTSIARQYLSAGFVDELRLHLVPTLLGAGIQLFGPVGGPSVDWRRTKAVEADGVTHLWFETIR